MIVKELPQEFLDAKPILETIKQAGFEAYLSAEASVTRCLVFRFMTLTSRRAHTRRKSRKFLKDR